MALQPAIVGLARVGNFRVGYVSPALAAMRAVRYTVVINGTERSHVVDRYTIEIIDDLNELPNTCRFECFGFTPARNQVVKVTYSGPESKEFEGTIISITEAHDKRNQRILYRVNCTDYTRLLDAGLVTKAYGSQSATAIAQDIITNFTSGFTQVNIAAGLPTVPAIQFKMTPVSSALRQLCDAFGGDAFVDYDKDVHVFLTDTTITPDALTTSNTDFKHLKYEDMIDRVVNRILVEGLGTTATANVAAGATSILVTTVSMFSATGGYAVVGNQIVTYSTIATVRPAAGPNASAAPGSGLTSGATYQYEYTYGTGSGETLPSPLTSLVAGGVTAAPGSGPIAGTPTSGGSVDAGTQDYEVTFVTSAGETTPSAISNSVTTTVLAAPSTPSIVNDAPGGAGYGPATGWPLPGDTVRISCTFTNAAGETTASSLSASITAIDAGFGNNSIRNIFPTVPSPPAGAIDCFVYLHINGSYSGKYYKRSLGLGGGFDSQPNFSGTPPGVNTATLQTVPLTSIPTGDANVTSRNVYRRFNGTGTFKLVTTIANNTATTYSDTTANASLGAAAPSSNTATTNQAKLTAILTGPSGTTLRKLYRTLANGSAPKLLATLGDNSTTTYTDSAADGALGADVPSTDTSGLSSGSPALLGIPSTGTGAVVNPINIGDAVNLLVQRDDTTSQGTYGTRQQYIQDRRLSIAGAEARGDAELSLRKDPFITGSFITTDTKVRSGRRITISMSDWSISGTFTITKVRMFWKEGDQRPQREVTFASNAGQNDLYRMLRRIRENQQQNVG